MKEGAWLNAHTGAWSWITNHASWIQDPSNARSLGMPEAAIERLVLMRVDFDGEGRRAILLEAMSHGFIRVRGHGATCTFEATVPVATTLQAAKSFMDANFGPYMTCRINDLREGESLSATYRELCLALESKPSSQLENREAP